MKEVVIININVDEYGLYSLTQSNIGYSLKRYLNENGIRAFQYNENNLPSVIDLADEILSYSNDVAIFIINKKNYKLVNSLAKILKEEDVEIIGIGSDELIGSFTNTDIDLYIYDNYHQNVLTYLKEGYVIKDNCIQANGQYNVREINEVEDLSNNIFDLEKAENINECSSIDLCITNGKASLDLNIINKNISIITEINPNIVINLYAKEMIKINEYEIIEIFKVLEEKNCLVKLIGSPKYIEKVMETAINEVNIKNITSIEVDIEGFEEVNTLLEENLRNFTGTLTIETNDYDKCNDKKYLEKYMETSLNNKIIVNLIDKNMIHKNVLILANNKEKNLAIENGVSMWQQGCYTQYSLNNTIKHVYLNEIIEEEKIQELNKLVSVNHAILIDKSQYKGNIGLEFAKHLHVIDKNKVIFDEGAFEKEYITLNYKECRNYNFDSCSELILKIEDNEDLKVFKEDVQEFNRTGVINEYMVNGFIMDACRFSCKGKCQVESTPKIEISNNGSISCCRSNIEIGKLGDDYFDLVNSIHKKSKSEALNRGCLNCPIKNTCGSCKMIPKGIDKENYCSLMKENLNIDTYILSALVIKALKTSVVLGSSFDIKNIKVIKGKINELFKKEYCNESKVKVRENIIILKFNELYILFDLLTNEILSLTPLIVYILEGYLNGYDLSEIKASAREDFVQDENIEDYIGQANNKLLELKVI